MTTKTSQVGKDFFWSIMLNSFGEKDSALLNFGEQFGTQIVFFGGLGFDLTDLDLSWCF